jgi:rhomboid protease GluP
VNEPRRRGTPATVFLITAILIGLAIEIAKGAWTNPFVLVELGAIEETRILDQGEYWRLLTAMFLHGDGTIRGTLLHLMMNLWALFQLGTIYEAMFGSKRFLWIYFITGIVASITSLIVTGGPSVGASGAIFGILGAFVFSVRRSPRWRHDPMARSLVKQCVFWAIVNVVVSSRIPQIDNAAHIGGLLAGLLLGFVWPQPTMPPRPPGELVIDVQPQDDRRA